MSTLYDTEFSPIAAKDGPIDLAARPVSRLSVVSLIFGILGMTVVPGLGSIIAIVTGHSALMQIREERERLGGRSLARSGLMLGYIALILIAAVIVFVISVMNYRTEIAAPRAALADPWVTPPASRVAPGVKMINEMYQADFALLSRVGIDASANDLIAYYNAGESADNPELAVLTNSKIIAVKDRRQTWCNLAYVAELTDDDAFEQKYNRNDPASNVTHYDNNGIVRYRSDPDVYHIEVRSKSGQIMHLAIRPSQGGARFFKAIEQAREAWAVVEGDGGEAKTTVESGHDHG